MRMLFLSLKTLRAGQNRLTAISESNKVVPWPLPFLAYTFCCFVDFRKAFDMVPRKNLWNRLEEIKVPPELRDSTIRTYDNVIVKFKNTEGWSK